MVISLRDKLQHLVGKKLEGGELTLQNLTNVLVSWKFAELEREQRKYVGSCSDS